MPWAALPIRRYIFLAARIENLLGVNAHGLTDTGIILHGAWHDLFRHCNTSQKSSKGFSWEGLDTPHAIL